MTVKKQHYVFNFTDPETDSLESLLASRQKSLNPGAKSNDLVDLIAKFMTKKDNNSEDANFAEGILDILKLLILSR